MNWTHNIILLLQQNWPGLLKLIVAVSVLLFFVAYIVLLERRLSAFIQDRLGPNRVGPFGLFQPLADAVKAFLKEDYTPGHTKKLYFTVAPIVAMVPAIMGLGIIPFGSVLGNEPMVIADLDVGILYSFGISSLGVYGILLAGYGSNSKYPLLGALRSGAQLISYEVVMVLAVIPVFLISGDLNLSKLVANQANSVSEWMFIKAPLSFLLFVILMFAETNRLPFDLPEAENELVGGYNTEYSSIRFALFFMAEYAHIILVSAIGATLFLGGWSLPWFGLNKTADSLYLGLAQIGVFILKTFLFAWVIVWTRWMLPRFRIDQLMSLAWKKIMPIALLNIFITATWIWLVP